MIISIIICTYNRSQYLKKVLENLLLLKNDGSFDHEIIIVDNNSKDNTQEIVESYILKNNKFKYFFEPKQGKSNALNTGISRSIGDIIAFTDDDVIINNDWVQNIANFSKENDFDAIGGRIIPLYCDGTPQWIKDCSDILSGPIVNHDYGEEIQPYNKKMLPFVGANMVIKQKMFKDYGGFNVRLGAGTGTMGEDSEFYRRLQSANMRIFYNPKILIIHPVDKNRMNLKYFAQWHMSSGKHFALKNIEDKKKDLVFIFGAPRYLFREVIHFLWCMVKSIGNTRLFIKAYTEFFIRIGMIKAYRYEHLH